MSSTLPKAEKTKRKLLPRFIIVFVLGFLLISLLLIVQYEDEVKSKFTRNVESEEVLAEESIENQIDQVSDNPNDQDIADNKSDDAANEEDVEMDGIEVIYEGFSNEEVVIPDLDEGGEPPIESDEELDKETSDDEDISTNLNPDIDLSGPEVEQKTNFTSYNYTIEFSEEGLDKYSSGIRYYIDPDECFYEDMIVGEQSFEGEFSSGVSELIEINIFIEDKFIDPTKGMEEVKYEITDLDDEIITTGSIQVPSCKSGNEKNRYGEFSIDKPIKDLTLLQGFHHFDYYFTYNEKAKENLEEGFSYHVEAEQCLAEGMNPEDYYFVGEFPPGELNTIGFGVNIKSDSLPEYDERLYVTSLYKITSFDGDELFSGYVQVPNCE